MIDWNFELDLKKDEVIVTYVPLDLRTSFSCRDLVYTLSWVHISAIFMGLICDYFSNSVLEEDADKSGQNTWHLRTC